jgi:hypothetical protein
VGRSGVRIWENPDDGPRSVEGAGDAAGDSASLLRAYLREVGSHQVLSRQEEVQLGKAIERSSAALHEALLRIPFTARFVAARWRALRQAKRVTATLSALPPGQRGPDANARIDRPMSRVMALLDRRAVLDERRDPRSEAERERIDGEIQCRLLEADSSSALLEEALDELRQRRAALSRSRAATCGKATPSSTSVELSMSNTGTVQGSVLSPLLGNVYLHYALDRWFERRVKPRLRGQATLVRYADDFVIGFEYKADAQRVMDALGMRLGHFGLALHPDKTRLLPFRRPPKGQTVGKGRATFDFLGSAPSRTRTTWRSPSPSRRARGSPSGGGSWTPRAPR